MVIINYLYTPQINIKWHLVVVIELFNLMLSLLGSVMNQVLSNKL